MAIKVIINGANGKMGQVTQNYLSQCSQINVVALAGKADDLDRLISDKRPDVVVDFTVPQAIFNNAKTIIEHNVHPVIGTTGLNDEQIKDLSALCKEKKLGGVIAPNFSVGAILMMQFSAQAARFFKDVEIIEMHHPAKLDAPSGTALKTAAMIENHSQSPLNTAAGTIQKENAARGEVKNQVPIHSIRLPGYFAHQAVIFGGVGETLTVRHDASDRSCMMPGVLLACEKVITLDRLIYGLEELLALN